MVASQLVTKPAAPDDPSVYGYDASQVLSATGEPAWGMLVDVLEAHPSQYTPRT